MIDLHYTVKVQWTTLLSLRRMNKAKLTTITVKIVVAVEMIIVPNICTMCWNFQSEKEYSIGIIEIDSKSKETVLKSQLRHLQAVEVWVSCLTSLGLIFLSFKMWILSNPNHLVALKKEWVDVYKTFQIMPPQRTLFKDLGGIPNAL